MSLGDYRSKPSMNTSNSWTLKSVCTLQCIFLTWEMTSITDENSVEQCKRQVTAWVTYHKVVHHLEQHVPCAVHGSFLICVLKVFGYFGTEADVLKCALCCRKWFFNQILSKFIVPPDKKLKRSGGLGLCGHFSFSILFLLILHFKSTSNRMAETANASLKYSYENIAHVIVCNRSEQDLLVISPDLCILVSRFS